MSGKNNQSKPAQQQAQPTSENKDESKQVLDQQGQQQLQEAAEPTAPEPETKQILLLGGFELAVRLGDLVKSDNTVDITPLATKVVAAIEAGEVPVFMQDLAQRLPVKAVEVYLKEVLRQGVDPSTVEFVIADPATDGTLKTLNFMRAIQGLAPTYFYPRFDAPAGE